MSFDQRGRCQIGPHPKAVGANARSRGIAPNRLADRIVHFEEEAFICPVLAPEKPIGFIHAAFILHETGCTDEARTLLLGGPDSLHRDATYHYNLACYECVLGNLDLARMHLDRSFELDKKFRDYAKSDPDLAKLHEG